MTSAADDEVSPSRWLSRAGRWLPIACVTALAAALRVCALGAIPPGLYHDEAFNGLDALGVHAGQWPIYFAANHGREPLFIYLIAATVSMLGRSPGALRLAAAVCGTLTIPATYLAVQAWFDRRVATLSAAILAITLWHIHLSRVGFRAVTLPLTTAVALWLGVRAYRSRHRWHSWLLAGLSYALCFYAYLPARVTPAALLAFTTYLVARGHANRLWPGVAWFAAGALVLLAPLVIYAAGHWDVVVGRPGQVFLGQQVDGRDLWGTLGRQLVRTLGMFFVSGDTIPRHNLPGRPVFDPVMGAMAVWGLARALLLARRQIAPAFALTWVTLMLVPTWLAEDAPHWLRAVGVLPLLTVFPALGINGAAAWVIRRGGRAWAVALTCGVLATNLVVTVRDYFVRYAAAPETYYAFESAAAELAAEANRFTGAGWDGSGVMACEGNPRPGRRVYVDRRLWDEWAAIPFLVPDTGTVVRIPTDQALPPSAGTLLLLWPYQDVKRYQDLLPRDSRIEARGGPLTRGDLEDTSYEAYVAYTAGPAGKATEPLARFGDQIVLVDCAAETGHDGLRVRLEWMALETPVRDYTVFVHLRDGQRVVAQSDAEPTEGHYPTGLWRPGDVVVDVHTLEPPRGWEGQIDIVVGLYVWPSMERLRVTAPTGEVLGEEFALSCGESSDPGTGQVGRRFAAHCSCVFQGGV